MKINFFLLLILISIIACKDNKISEKRSSEKNRSTIDSIENLDLAHKIANANGYENWKNVLEIAFTFNVNRGKNHFERSWVWNPKSGNVAMISSQDTIKYNRSQIDSLLLKTDAAFINDTYWLLAPFQITWDKSASFTEKEQCIAPISKDTLNQLTITYGNNGGYTPGDAYDFFYDENFKIKEWNFRQGNAKTPSMTTTWEDYENFKGIELAKTHRDSTGNFKLYFSNISVKTETDN